MYLPGLSPVVRLLNVHRCRPEGLEGDDEVGHVELGLQVQLYGHVLHPVLGLPPGPVLVLGLRVRRLHPVDDGGDPVGGPRVGPDALGGRVAPKALLVLLGPHVQVGEDAVALLPVRAAGGRGVQLVLPPDQQVARGRVTRPVLAAVAHGGVASDL